tara:strand:- start:494 stop:625 length:132 start_codon:yes stop_codon:yes gene_type:complete
LVVAVLAGLVVVPPQVEVLVVLCLLSIQFLPLVVAVLEVLAIL